MPTIAATESEDSKTTPEQLAIFNGRRHPLYDQMLPHWRFLMASFKGGPSWFADNIFPYHKEGKREFTKRLSRAYRFNHTREVVGLVQKYLFKAPAVRNKTEASDTIKDFWLKSTLAGQSIEQFMRSASVQNSVCGRVAVVVDNNYQTAPDAKDKISEAEAKAMNLRAYVYMVEAPDILDYAFDEDGDGELLWVKLREFVRDDRDPIFSTGDTVTRIRLWTREHWMLFEEKELPNSALNTGINSQVKTYDKTLELVGSGQHELGFVPVKLFDHAPGNSPYESQALIDEVAYLDRAVTNYLSNLDAIIQDQTFSQLTIPVQAIQPGDSKMNKVVEMSTKRAFTYDGANGSKPEYISPDPKQAGVIITVINKIINEIYSTIGLAGERTKEDNAVGIDNSSGVAKAYDFERVNALLLAKASACEDLENWIVNTVNAWNGDAPLKNPLVSYPTTFDVMRLSDELVTAEALQKVEAPKEIRREQMRQLVKKLFPQISRELNKKLDADVSKWLDEVVDASQPQPAAGAAKAVAAPKRQGSVTSATPSKEARERKRAS